MRWLPVPLFVMLLACSGVGMPKDDDEEEGVTVTVVELGTVGRADVVEHLITSAVVQSELQADLVPVAPGVVRELFVEEGERVSKGQKLAVLDNVSLDANASRAAADLRKLQADLASTRELLARGAVSEQEVANLQHQVATARTSASEASRTRGQTVLRAPFDGVVAVRDLRLGEYASTGARAFQVVDLDQLQVVASLPERDVARVRVGQHAELISVYDPDQVALGTVTRVAPVVDAASGTFRVTIGLDADQDVLRPGQFVSVQLEVDRHVDALSVEKRAVTWEDGAPVVYRMIDPPPPDPDADEDGAKRKKGKKKAEKTKEADADAPPAPPSKVAQRVRVKLGLVDDDRAEIVDGLSQGDPVVVVGQSNLKDGAPIRAAGPAPDEEGGDAAAAEDP